MGRPLSAACTARTSAGYVTQRKIDARRLASVRGRTFVRARLAATARRRGLNGHLVTFAPSGEAWRLPPRVRTAVRVVQTLEDFESLTGCRGKRGNPRRQPSQRRRLAISNRLQITAQTVKVSSTARLGR